MEADWRDVLRQANDLSIAHSFALAVRSADLLHVAYAVELPQNFSSVSMMTSLGWPLPPAFKPLSLNRFPA